MLPATYWDGIPILAKDATLPMVGQCDSIRVQRYRAMVRLSHGSIYIDLYICCISSSWSFLSVTTGYAIQTSENP